MILGIALFILRTCHVKRVFTVVVVVIVFSLFTYALVFFMHFILAIKKLNLKKRRKTAAFVSPGMVRTKGKH